MACGEPTLSQLIAEGGQSDPLRTCLTAEASPLFLQQFAVALPPLLVNGVGVEYGQADDDEGDGGGRDQHLQGQVHLPRLGATSGDVACETVRGEAETERQKSDLRTQVNAFHLGQSCAVPTPPNLRPLARLAVGLSCDAALQLHCTKSAQKQ